MEIIYQSSGYEPEKVTGKYVRCEGKKPNYRFKVFETETCQQKGPFFGKKGMGYTLREYVTSGEEIPQEVKERCIKSKTTEKWWIEEN